VRSGARRVICTRIDPSTVHKGDAGSGSREKEEQWKWGGEGELILGKRTQKHPKFSRSEPKNSNFRPPVQPPISYLRGEVAGAFYLSGVTQNGVFRDKLIEHI
jgi:hypothetical protein